LEYGPWNFDWSIMLRGIIWKFGFVNLKLKGN
jgi:hypothetical protein